MNENIIINTVFHFWQQIPRNPPHWPFKTLNVNSNVNLVTAEHSAFKGCFLKGILYLSLSIKTTTSSTPHHSPLLSLSVASRLFGLPTWCQVWSVIPAWFSGLKTGTVLLRAAWSITLCLSLIHSTFQRLWAVVCLRVSTKGRQVERERKSETVFRHIYCMWIWHRGFNLHSIWMWWAPDFLKPLSHTDFHYSLMQQHSGAFPSCTFSHMPQQWQNRRGKQQSIRWQRCHMDTNCYKTQNKEMRQGQIPYMEDISYYFQKHGGRGAVFVECQCFFLCVFLVFNK